MGAMSNEEPHLAYLIGFYKVRPFLISGSCFIH